MKSKRKNIFMIAMFLVIVSGIYVSDALATSDYLVTFNMKYNTVDTRLDTCDTCHQDQPILNKYGEDLKDSLNMSTTIDQSLAEIEPSDSDGDGFTNIEEINDNTFPGDANDFPSSDVKFITDNDVYNQGESVILTIVNNGTTTIDLPSSAPWQIWNAAEEIVFSPFAAAVITPVEPGKSISWTWDQKDNEEKQVPPGKYKSVIQTSIGNISTKEFDILTNDTQPIIMRFIVDKSTSINENRPAIAYADVEDNDLWYFAFNIVDTNNLLSPYTIIYRIDTNISYNGTFVSSPWYGDASQIKENESSNDSEYITTYYNNDPNCSWCDKKIMAKAVFKNNETANSTFAYIWFDDTGIVTNVTDQDMIPLEIESGNSTILVLSLAFVNGIDQVPLYIGNKIYTLYTIGDNRNPILTTSTVPIGRYKVEAYAQDVSGQNSSSWIDVDTIPYTFEIGSFIRSNSGVEYMLEINNTGIGNIAVDTYDLFVDNPDEANVSLSSDNITLDTGENESIALVVNSAISGTYVVNVTASPQLNPANNRTIQTKTYINVANMTGFRVGDGIVGEYVESDVTINNLDNQSHWFLIIVDGNNTNNTNSLIGTGTLKLNAGESAKVPVWIAVPPTYVADIYELYARLYIFDDYHIGPLIYKVGPVYSSINIRDNT